MRKLVLLPKLFQLSSIMIVWRQGCWYLGTHVAWSGVLSETKGGMKLFFHQIVHVEMYSASGAVIVDQVRGEMLMNS